MQFFTTTITGKSSYFVGEDWLPYQNNPDYDKLNWDKNKTWIHSRRGDWRKEYWDKAANQAFHFWFYVAVAYFDTPGTAWATLGNVVHDYPPNWEDYDYVNSPEQVAPPPSGNSKPDFLLGIQGIILGTKMRNLYEPGTETCGPSDDLLSEFNPARWILANLRE